MVRIQKVSILISLQTNKPTCTIHQFNQVLEKSELFKKVEAHFIAILDFS